MTWTEPFVNLCWSMFYSAGVKHVWHHRVGDQESGRKWPIRACTQKAENAHYLTDSYVYKYIQRCAQDTRRYFECLLILCLLQMFSTFSNLDLLNHQWAVFYQFTGFLTCDEPLAISSKDWTDWTITGSWNHTCFGHGGIVSSHSSDSFS